MTPPVAPEPRQLAVATAGALAIAALVLLAAVLPAEFGVDPTGIGSALGFKRLSDAAQPDATAEPDPTTFVFDARWVLVEREVANASGALTRADSQRIHEIPLAVANLTRLRAHLAWTDDAPASGPDLLEVSIRAPDGRRSELAPSDTGHANATLVWRPAPYPEEVEGAWRIASATDASSHGTWTIVVRLYGTGATPEAPDAGNAYTLRIDAESYALTTRAAGGAADKVSLTLRPQGQLEYKFAMDANATMTYRWSASAVIRADLHADHFDDPEDVETAKVLDVDGDEGTYTAPFHGRHGWYFRNPHEFPVTIALETRGDYEILGVVT